MISPVGSSFKSINKKELPWLFFCFPTLHKKWSFPLRISSVNVTKCDHYTVESTKLSTWRTSGVSTSRSSRSEVFLGKGVLKICNKFTGEHPCRSMISIKLLCSFIEVTLRHGCSFVNLLHIFATPFSKSFSGRLPLNFSNASKAPSTLSAKHPKCSKFNVLYWIKLF